MIEGSVLIDAVSSYLKASDIKIIQKACDFSKEAHKDQKRISGEPYYYHPLEVAYILSEYKLGASTIVAALLHDTVEDTKVTIEDIVNNFGEDVSKLVEGVTKLTKIEYQSENKRQAENFCKLLVAISEDIRVLLIKLADRIHNMRTIAFISSEEKKQRIAYETMEIYAPLAERIGMQSFKSELQELSFAILYPEQRESIASSLKYLHGKDDNVLQKILDNFKKLLLQEYKLKDEIYTISGREKTPFSIWQKMKQKNIGFEKLSDIIAFRIITKDVLSCYKILGIIHTNYQMIPNNFTDFISTPKNNGYQSLHTVIMYQGRGCIEVQIRTKEMDEIAEKGVAAHWAYKQSYGQEMDNKQYSWIRELLNILEHTDTKEEFLEFSKLQMYYNQVFCFTPKGKVIGLPKGAMPLDFAYSVSCEIGNKFAGAKVNGQVVSMGAHLKNGDQVEIITSPDVFPVPYWRDFVITGKAVSEIKCFVIKQEQERYVKLGKKMLAEIAAQENFALDTANINKLLDFLDGKEEKEVYLAIIENKLIKKDIIAILSKDNFNIKKARSINDSNNFNLQEEVLDYNSDLIGVKGSVEKEKIEISKCCMPLPGDLILGIKCSNGKILIHSSDCFLLAKNIDNKENVVEVYWKKDPKPKVSVAIIKISLLNKIGSFAALSNRIATEKVNIINFKIIKRFKDYFDIILEISVLEEKHLSNIICSIRELEEVLFVERYKLKS